MNKKKNIDRFFQEHLEHFEVAPPEIAWENIKAKLNEKEKKRRVIPFWWKLSGIAAVLFIGFGLITTFFNTNPKQDTIIVNQQNNTSNDVNAADKLKQLNTTKSQKSVASKDENTRNLNSSESNNSSIEKNVTTSLTKKKQTQKSVAVSDINAKKNDFNSDKKRQNSDKVALKSNANIASNAINKKPYKKSNTFSKKNLIAKKELPSNNTIATKTTVKTSEINIPIITTNTSVDKNANSKIDDKSTLAILENTDKKIEEIKKIDSTKMANVEPNALEELLTEKEKKIAKERKLNRWQVAPNVAPIYFSSMSNGSPLDEKLASNQKAYGTNYSYGLGVNYALNKKLKIRSGVHTFSVDYDTKDIVFYQNTNASRMQNVTPNLQGSLIQIDPLSNVNSSFGRLIEDKFEGTLNQRMAYIEMPLEVSYKLIAKKFGVDVIGGISTLFLSQNDVYLKTSGFNMKIGEANNLNTIHFSTNIGLGLKYSFLKRFDARIEPLFKYQLNTYSSGAGNFKPYVFGVYSGISYHF